MKKCAYLCTVKFIFMYRDMVSTDNNITYVSRPKGRPDTTTKGKLNEWSNGYREFIPQGQKPSNRTMLKQIGNSSFYKSEGQKESSYSLHLNVDGRSADPVGELFEQFMHLTAGERKQEPQLPEGQRGRMLFDNESLQMWLDGEKHQLDIMACLPCSPDIERCLLQAQSQMNVTLGRYRTEIIKG